MKDRLRGAQAWRFPTSVVRPDRSAYDQSRVIFSWRAYSLGSGDAGAGRMLAFRWNTFSGSYCALISASRSYFCGP